MNLCFSNLLLSSLIYFSLVLFILKLIMPYCYLYCYYYYHFCRKSVHSFLDLSKTSSCSPPHHHHHHVSKCELGLIIANDFNPNVIASYSLQHPNTKSMLPTSPTKKKDPGGIGFIDDMDGGVHGPVSCTESLGFESCNERRVDNKDDDCEYVELSKEEFRDKWKIKKKIEEKRSEDKRDNKFPPPLSSLNQNGRPIFYLKPVRQNGRLELTEVKLHRPEVLRVVRENGRLRMNLVSTDICSKTNDEEQEENEEMKQEEQVHKMQQEEDEHKMQQEEDEEEEMKVEGLWNYRVSGEGSRRCHEMVNYHQHHAWRQPCVSIR